MIHQLLTVEIRYEQDIVLARRRARQIAALLGLDPQGQIRLATAVSEIARNAFQYARGGKVEFEVTDEPVPAIRARITDGGPGIAGLRTVMDGRYVSRTGMGLGIIGARRLLDDFELQTAPGGTTVLLVKHLGRGAEAPSAGAIASVVDQLAQRTPDDPVAEIQAQNQELLRTLNELRQRQTEVERLNRELAETNRGVVALYAELDERAQELGRASDLKTRFLSNISHELRTPLNSVLNVSRLLLDRVDGPLTSEQERQVRLIRGGAESLLSIVNDLLDIARIEAGKTPVRPSAFTVEDLFAALRGMFRPLVIRDGVQLAFGDADGLPAMFSDEGKLSQILRNLVANALKFTERGEVRLWAEARTDDTIAFHVSDTGIGIPVEDQTRIFEEFAQVEGPLQRTAGGTGLGLPLSRRLATLLGGTLTVRSAVGAGSTFTVVLPLAIAGTEAPASVPEEAQRV